MKIKNKLYSESVEIIFESFKHQYTDSSGEIPSVTKCLSIIAKPQLISWAANMAVDSIQTAITPGKSYDELELQAIFEAGRKAHFQKKVDAGTIGSFLHRWIEQYIDDKNPALPVNEGLRESVNKFLSWVEEHRVKFILSEQIVFSKKYRYVGTLDFICVIDGKMYVGDLKTSNGIYKVEYGSQLAAYKMAREEEFPKEKYEGCILLRIGKTKGDFEIWQFSDDLVFKDTFLYALKLYEKTEEIKRLEAKS